MCGRFTLSVDLESLRSAFPWLSIPMAPLPRYNIAPTQPVAVVVSEGDRILYSVLSKPFSSEFGIESRWATRSRDLPVKSLTRRLNAGGKLVSEERRMVRADSWFPQAGGKLIEEVVGLARYGKTLTVLLVKM